MRINLDLHIHSKYSAATSKRMDLPTIAREAAKKGIGIVGTGDCLHPRWLAEVMRLEKKDGLYHLGKTLFALSVEVEDISRVHHLILVPEASKAHELRETFIPHSSNIDSDGRPNISLTAPEIADAALEAGCIIGPGHAFTPWTGLYAHHPSLDECYGDLASKIRFVELGLSADTDYADRIEELQGRALLSNSDAHSPWSNKLAREFVQMEIEDQSFAEVEMALKSSGGRHLTLNVGLYPEEGKYNRTACTRCYRQYKAGEMDDLAGRCPCGGMIKLGVRDRVEYLADWPEVSHPPFRPPYLHLIPLAEIIAMALGHKGIHTAGVQRCWNELVAGTSEIEVLVEADLGLLKADRRVIEAIEAFRRGDVVVTPGGGGRYGSICLPGGRLSEKEEKRAPAPAKETQRSLFEFGDGS
ncbi:MAG: endonuclease Q family protein [Methanotrichaceae archaeon]|nr:endonuclease Q family protein [Methanotrichaceae archaeon]